MARPFRSTGRQSEGSSALERGREEECVIARPDPNSAILPQFWTPILDPNSDHNSGPDPNSGPNSLAQFTCPQFTLTPMPFNSSFRQDPCCSPSLTA